MFERNISMQCAPLWNILNIYKEWVGTSWPCTQLQEAIRTAKVSESCSGLVMRHKRFLVTFAAKIWVLHAYEYLSATFQCSAPLWNILNIYREWVGTSWPCTQLQEAIRTAKDSESCRGLAMRPSVSVSFQICGNSLVATACIWMFECSISMQCAPLKLKHSEYLQLQGIIGDQLTICAAVGWPCASGVPFKICGNSLVATACMHMNVWVQRNISIAMQCAPLKHSKYLQGMSGDQLTICAAARSNQNDQSLWETAVAWPCAQA